MSGTNKIRRFFKRLLCRHQWEKLITIEGRIWQCPKCDAWKDFTQKDLASPTLGD